MRQFVKKPDLSAPRYRKRPYKIDKDKLYREFIKKHPEYKEVCDPQLFKQMIYDFNTAIWETVIYERDGAELPDNLGTIFIGTCKASTRRGNVNPRLSSDYGQKLRNTNMVTDSKVAKIFYSNYAQKYHFKNRQLWTFSAHRDFKRATSKEYKNSWQKYVLVEPYARVNRMYDRYMRRQQAQKKEAENMINYDEFDFDD